MPDATIERVLNSVGCAHLADTLSACTFAELSSLERSVLLARLKELGVAKLAERQKVANALSKAAREALPTTPSVASQNAKSFDFLNASMQLCALVPAASEHAVSRALEQTNGDVERAAKLLLEPPPPPPPPPPPDPPPSQPVESASIARLRSAFPNASATVLEATLEAAAGDVELAATFLLDSQPRGSADSQPSPAHNNHRTTFPT
jgi:hypothetical protein